jgi:hypothetical protein
MQIEFKLLRHSPVSSEHGNEHPSSIKGREFLDQLSDYKFLSSEWI